MYIDIYILANNLVLLLISAIKNGGAPGVSKKIGRYRTGSWSGLRSEGIKE
jgi:hypothetical protein